MKKNILVAVAWPYANARIHAGNLTGAYLPADIFARFQRLRGNRVLMVSGSDAHGTPVTVRADAEKTTPLQIYQRFHNGFLELFQKVGITYDLFTSTHTQNHYQVSQAIFLALKKNGFLYTEKQKQWYAPAQNRFLPDRYVEGTCYLCGYPHARGDQCDKCGNILDATLLIDPRSKTDDTTPELRETEHFFLDLGKLQNEVIQFLREREEYLRPNVTRQSLGQILADGLHGRAITRDLDWGIPVPVEGWQGKCLYVWFEAVIGYLSATIEWASITEESQSWKDWWQDRQALAYYFIGKDNIPFHAVIWPAQLIGSGSQFCEFFEGKTGPSLNLPFDIPANEFMNLEGQKISGSRNWVIDGMDFLSRYDPDPFRYYLTTNMPETKDTDWDWAGFVHRNNDELVATWGNLANRVLSFAYKYWEGRVPEPGALRTPDNVLLATIEKGLTTVADHVDAVHLRAGLSEAMDLSGAVNKYLDDMAPWSEIKKDKTGAGTTIYTALHAIDSLKIMFSPYLPFSSEQLHKYMGYDEPIFGEQSLETLQDELGEHTALRYHPAASTGKWEVSRLKGGEVLRQPAPLFRKLEDSVVAEERNRLGK